MQLKIGIPVLNRGDLLFELVRSIDVEADVLIVVNRIGPVDSTVEEAVARLEERPPANLRLTAEWIDGNLGVSGSWNRIIDYFGGDCIVSNNDIQFTPGILSRAFAQIAKHPDIVLHHLYAAACFYAGREFTGTLGWFDENFYPAYGEDQEMSARSARLGVHRCVVKGLGQATIRHGGSETVRNATKAQRAFISSGTRRNREYLAKRWGAVGKRAAEHSRKVYPFDDPSVHPSEWRLNLDARTELAVTCERLTGFPCPIRFHRATGGLTQKTPKTATL
jgi:hypothetical protein